VSRNLNAQKLEDIEQAITSYKTLKLKVAITELDLTMTGAGGGTTGARSAGRSDSAFARSTDSTS
jgi:GH35 family endo-1,4-beta-xylanase